MIILMVFLLALVAALAYFENERRETRRRINYEAKVIELLERMAKK